MRHYESFRCILKNNVIRYDVTLIYAGFVNSVLVGYEKLPRPRFVLSVIGNTAVKRLRMRELSGEKVEEHQLMMMILHR